MWDNLRFGAIQVTTRVYMYMWNNLRFRAGSKVRDLKK